MASTPVGQESDKYKVDLIKRGIKRTNWMGTAVFCTGRAADVYLQYGILGKGYGTSLIEALRGRTLPRGPAIISNTPLDGLGLSPYRSILWLMSLGAAAKQTFHLLAIMQEEVTPGASLAVSLFNAAFNSVNTLLFVCGQTSASVNGEHYPQTPLIVGTSIYAVGLSVEWLSEIQRALYKKDRANAGKVYQGGLFGLSRHVNYFGYTLWRSGFAITSGGWLWGAATAAFFTYDFTQRAIPVLQEYMSIRYGEQYAEYEHNVPYKFVPFLW